MVRTSGFHPLNRGSIPRSATNKKLSPSGGGFLFMVLEELNEVQFCPTSNSRSEFTSGMPKLLLRPSSATKRKCFTVRWSFFFCLCSVVEQSSIPTNLAFACECIAEVPKLSVSETNGPVMLL